MMDENYGTDLFQMAGAPGIPSDMPVAVEVFSGADWKANVENMLEQLIAEQELPKKSLYLGANYGRDGKKITSYSICIYEPDYPLPLVPQKVASRNTIVVRIKESKGALELSVDAVAAGNLGLPEEASIKNGKSDADKVVSVIFRNDSTQLVPFLNKLTKYTLSDYTPKAASFGCCDLFRQCSDAKRCLHVNKLYSKACAYRLNLEAGRIFYGKNANQNVKAANEKEASSPIEKP